MQGVPAVSHFRRLGFRPIWSDRGQSRSRWRVRGQGEPIADGDEDDDGAGVTGEPGVADGPGAVEVPGVRPEVDVVLGASGEVELRVTVAGGVLRGVAVGVRAGVVTTPTMVGAGFGAGRTNR